MILSVEKYKIAHSIRCFVTLHYHFIFYIFTFSQADKFFLAWKGKNKGLEKYPEVVRTCLKSVSLTDFDKGFERTGRYMFKLFSLH